MAWTAPRTWVAGETVTAAIGNTHWRDNLKAIGDPWTAYTPTWTAVTANPAIGNGTLTGASIQAGKMTNFRAIITIGSTTTLGTGQWRLTLPVAASNLRWSFVCEFFDLSAALSVTGRATWNNSVSTLDLWVPGVSAGGYDRAMATGIPIAQSTGDIITVSGDYEAA